MDSARYADWKISEAMARGELDPQEGVGEPLVGLTNDPDWWIRAFMERELLPERFAEIQASVLARTAAAVQADDLSTARGILAAVNADIRQWNDRADSPFHLEEHTELWLVTERARRPASK